MDKAHQMNCREEHHSELHPREHVVTPQALDNIEHLPVMEELAVVNTVDKLRKAIDSLAPGQPPRNDSIPPEFLKRCKKPHYTNCMNPSTRAGMKTLLYRTCKMPKFPPSIRTEASEVTATTREEFHLPAPQARSMLRSSSTTHRSWHNMSTQNHSAAPKLEDPH